MADQNTEAAVAVVQGQSKPQGALPKSIMVEKASRQRLIVASVAVFTLLLSLPVLASVIWLLYMRAFDCESLLRLPRLQVGIGVALIFVFAISNAVIFLRSRIPAPGLLLVMVPLIIMFTSGLALVGAYKMESRSILASPTWLKLKVYDDNNWNYIKSCIYDTRTCDDLMTTSMDLKSYDINMRRLSPIEFGCCRPPVICDMDYVNATYWRKKDTLAGESETYDEDCSLWRNDRDILCYNCFACRDGYLRAVEGKWWRLGLFLVIMALLLIVSHLLLFLATMWERFEG